MPRLRLTATQVDTLPAIGGKRTEYADAIVPGLVLRVTPHGHRSWSVQFWQGHGRRGRRSVRYTIGPASRVPLASAREQARAILDRGMPPADGRGLTVAVMVERMLDGVTLKPSTRHEWTRLARVEIASSIGRVPASELKRSDIRLWMRDIGRRSGVTANRAFGVLRRAFSWAVDEELLEHSPCSRMRLRFTETSSDRVLTQAELRALMSVLHRLADFPHADLTWLLLFTGVRIGAAIGICRRELHLDGQVPWWVVPGVRSKNGRAHMVPLSPPALDLVRRRMQATPTEHLFPAGGHRAGHDVPMWRSRRWPGQLRAAVNAELPAPAPRWTIHNLRHTMATHMREQLGVNRDVVSLVLGHTLPGITAVYDRSRMLDERSAALNRWADWLAAVAAGTEPTTRVLPFQR